MISEAQFRTEAITFLERNAKRRDLGSDAMASDWIRLFQDQTLDASQREIAEARAWRARVFDAGLGWIAGPASYGGRALPRAYEALYRSLESEFDVPPDECFAVGLGMVAPTVLAHGGAETKDYCFPALYRGDLIACQLFSEPEAGSDLAGVRTRAVPDGDEWVLNGQKVWTSGAHYADLGEILTRTSSDPASPHRGLTMFLMDMRAAGVEVRPLRQMTGGASFNEVFLHDVRVPDARRLGAVGEGWSVAMTTLMSERAAIGHGVARAGTSVPARLRELVGRRKLGEDVTIRQIVADLWVRDRIADWTSQRILAGVPPDEAPEPIMSLAKLAYTQNLQRFAEAAARLLGPALVADTGEWGTYAWAEFVLGVPGMRLGGGTDEILREVLGERVLGLPKEPQPRNRE
ncbi:MAG: acyl-CoA dehydrogenase family protein [Actinomycetota bacterium]